jgi:arylsulfatase A-like enzyme
LIVRWPGITQGGGVSRQPVTVSDLYPTLLAATGLDGNVEHNEQVDGLDLTPVLRDPAATLERAAIYHHYPHYYATTTPVSGIRAGDWKLLEYFEDGRLELYNLRDDPGESRNLADEEPAQRDQLLGRLRAWRESVDALTPVPNPEWQG